MCNAVHVQILISAGAEIDAIDDIRWTPLHDAAYALDADKIRNLLGAGASTTILDSLQRTPFDVAKELRAWGHEEALKAALYLLMPRANTYGSIHVLDVSQHVR